MSRNFGLYRGTTPRMSGDQPSAGPHHVAYTTRDDSNVISLADHFPSRGDRLNSRRLTAAAPFIPADDSFELGQLSEPPFDYREFAACVRLGLRVLTPALIFTAAIVIYATLIA